MLKTIAPLFSPSALFALALMAVIVMMILPMPAWVLDIGLAASFSLAILVFTITLFIEKPLDFSAFPTILLASLMLRLSLNVSSTKLIIGQGHSGPGAAGNVIEGFASFVMGGSLTLGLVVFGVLLIVNFVVITKGATRMAEVGARFALDAMPGKQMAIDSDVSVGAISHDDARNRRDVEQRETTFLGSLDGASKFVKGDAIAGLLITFLNLVVGLIMGIVVHGLDVQKAFETYAILTVGDGLVSQIPAVILSIASALLLSRGGVTGTTDLAVFGQLGQSPQALATVAGLLTVFGLVPGLPFVPFILGALVLGGSAYWLNRQKVTEGEIDEPLSLDTSEKPLGDTLDLDDIHILFAPDLVEMVLDPGTGLDARIGNMRLFLAESFGFLLPEIRLTDEARLPPGTYAIRIQGVEIAQGKLVTDSILALPGPEGGTNLRGEPVKEPVFGADAYWVPKDDREDLALEGITTVSAAEVLATHLLELIKANFSRLLTMRGLNQLLDELTQLSDSAKAATNRKLLDDLIPEKVPPAFLLSVLRHLLEEQVSVRNLPLILEAVAEAKTATSSPESVCEHVRRRIGFQIVADLKRQDGSIPLLQLDPDWESRFRNFQTDEFHSGMNVALPPEMFSALSDAIAKALTEASGQGVRPAVVVPSQRRRFLHSVIKANRLKVPVLSFEEIGLEAQPALVGVVQA